MYDEVFWSLAFHSEVFYHNRKYSDPSVQAATLSSPHLTGLKREKRVWELRRCTGCNIMHLPILVRKYWYVSCLRITELISSTAWGNTLKQNTNKVNLSTWISWKLKIQVIVRFHHIETAILNHYTHISSPSGSDYNPRDTVAHFGVYG